MAKIKIIFALALMMLGNLVSAHAAPVYTIGDPWKAWGSYSSGDRIGDYKYELYGMNIAVVGDELKFDIFTNYSGSDSTIGSWKTYASDLAISSDGDDDYEFGVAFYGQRKDKNTNTNRGLALTPGSLYSVDTGYNNTYVRNGWFISNYYEPNKRNSGVNYYYHNNTIVTMANLTSSTAIDTHSLIWTSLAGGDGGSNPLYMITTYVDIKDILPTGYGKIDFMYGSATCANDYLKGSFSVTPEPSSLILLGMGLLGLAGIGKKKKIASK